MVIIHMLDTMHLYKFDEHLKGDHMYLKKHTKMYGHFRTLHLNLNFNHVHSQIFDTLTFKCAI